MYSMGTFPTAWKRFDQTGDPMFVLKQVTYKNILKPAGA